MLLTTEFLIKNLMIISLIFSYFLTNTKNAIYSALSLIVVILSTSIILWLVGAEFLAMMYIIIYLGAIAVLFLFVVMMLNVEIKIEKKNRFFNTIKLFKNFFFNLKNYHLKIYTIRSNLRSKDNTIYKPLPKESFLESSRIQHFFIIISWVYFLLLDSVLLITNTISERIIFSILGSLILLNFLIFYIFNLDRNFSIYDEKFLKLINFKNFFNFVYNILFFFSLLLIIVSPISFFLPINYNNSIFLNLINSNYLQNTAVIGELIYFEYGFLFILASFILLIAMIGAILITLKKDSVSKKQFISKQINRNLNDTVSFYKIYKK